MPHPFGLKFGDTPSADVASYRLNFHSVPNPHPDLIEYWGTWDPKRGLTSVHATSRPFSDDASGSGAQRLYNRLKKQLRSVYGKPEEIEFIEDSAVWDGDGEFVRSIFEDERTHLTAWAKDRGASLDAGIVRIMLGISADSEEESHISLTYQFVDESIGAPGDDVGLGSL